MTIASETEAHLDGSLGQSYFRLVAAAHVAIGAVAWSTHCTTAPVAASIVLASCVALGTAFREVSRSTGWIVLCLSVGSILATYFATYTPPIPDWLLRGPWTPLVQSAVIAALCVSGIPRRSDGATLSTDSQREANEEVSVSSPLGRWSSGRRIGIAVAIALIAYLVGLPVAEELWARISPPPTSTVIEDMTLGESMRLRSVQVFAGVWAFAFGACVGSFLNVLVYRQPRGESVLAKPSACPSCSMKIETRDNLPVVGWLMLGGRCRSCQAPISSRYPIVEAIVGAIFAVLVFVELTSGGGNLPVRRINSYTGFVWTIFYPKWDLIALTLYHFHLFVMLTTWALMTKDQVRVPWRSIVPAWLIAGALPLVWTRLWLVPPVFAGDWAYTQPLPVVAWAALAGALAGACLAGLFYSFGWGEFRTLLAALGLIGMTLGWQAVLTVGVLAGVAFAILRVAKRTSWSFVSVLGAVTFVHHIAWRIGVDLALQFGGSGS